MFLSQQQQHRVVYLIIASSIGRINFSKSLGFLKVLNIYARMIKA